ncbi:MAG: glycine--tRNA ligase subunit beta [Alphaproteobacteria bacterium]|jgi:glycyl-tRNA synthetase beta chain|nr:glycine--tRNA ligase subunit beta [Alphaproteobacteria bacterium]
MPELLIELLSEEIPARMQARAEADLLKAIGDGVNAAGLSHDTGFAWSGPRRLGVCLQGMAARSEDVREERKGPKTGAPDKAIEGFLRGAGLASIDEAEIRSDPKKGEFYVAVVETPGRAAEDIIAELVPGVIRGFHWPKSMRWGEGELRWVRPLHRITCVLDGKVVPFGIGGLASGNETEGHRVHGRGPFTVTGWEDYRTQLETDGKVRLTREDRRAHIGTAAKKACAKQKLELVEDPGLLEEVTGLAEWPVVILGDMDPAFLDLPDEVIRLSMRTHQKYFAVRDPKTGQLAPHFVVVANIAAKDRGKKIAEGNSRVLSARLNDARFFWENDRKKGLDAMAGELHRIAFKEKLGSIGDKVERVAALARELAPKVGADPDLAERAARLAKADLVSEMVYEFPELQGVMGRYYALEAGEPADIADAIADHYRPQGPSDDVPTAPVSIAVALADKLDTLVGFWAIDEKPTGSKDPFALRRAALGVVRIVLENGVRVAISSGPVEQHFFEFDQMMDPPTNEEMHWMHRETLKDIAGNKVSEISDHPRRKAEFKERSKSHQSELNVSSVKPLTVESGLLAFFADRLKQVLRDQGKRHDLIDAVFALGTPPQSGEAGERPPAGQAAPAEAPAQRAAVSANDDLVLITRRVEALTGFLATEDGANLLAGYKRAANFLRDEEKKDGKRFEGAPDRALFSEETERALHSAIKQARGDVDAALANEDFEAAMSALARLRGPVDAFLDDVMVNVEDGEVRQNRLLILAAIRDALHAVADFSKIEN